ncbi:MAG: NADH-quinone oxidoreductase subunit NuoK [Bdellovibrionales bacterium]
MTIGLGHYLTLGSLLFVIGLLGVVLNRRNMIVLLMAIELMLLAANINLVAFSHFGGTLAGQVFTMMILTVAAAESAIGLAIFVVAFRKRGNLDVTDIAEMKG